MFISAYAMTMVVSTVTMNEMSITVVGGATIMLDSFGPSRNLLDLPVRL